MDNQKSEDRSQEAMRITKNYMGWSAGAAFLPVPLLDLAAVSGIQMKMVADIAAVYDQPFSSNVVKSIVASLIGSVGPSALARGASSLVKSVPGIGSVLGAVTGPALASAATYAIGKVFTQHFEAGGNILNFDANAMKNYFKEQFDGAIASDKSKKPAAA